MFATGFPWVSQSLGELGCEVLPGRLSLVQSGYGGCTRCNFRRWNSVHRRFPVSENAITGDQSNTAGNQGPVGKDNYGEKAPAAFRKLMEKRRAALSSRQVPSTKVGGPQLDPKRVNGGEESEFQLKNASRQQDLQREQKQQEYLYYSDSRPVSSSFTSVSGRGPARPAAALAQDKPEEKNPPDLRGPIRGSGSLSKMPAGPSGAPRTSGIASPMAVGVSGRRNPHQDGAANFHAEDLAEVVSKVGRLGLEEETVEVDVERTLPSSWGHAAGLNEEQLRAVAAKVGPVRVVAGPGSGKTRVLTHRVAFLIQEYGFKPEEIVCITFTNKAASELKSRLSSLVQTGVNGLTACTFHSLGARILRRSISALPSCGRTASFSIIDSAESKQMLKAVILENRARMAHIPAAMFSRVKQSVEEEEETMQEQGKKEAKNSSPAKKGKGRPAGLNEQEKRLLDTLQGELSYWRRHDLGRKLEVERRLDPETLTGRYKPDPVLLDCLQLYQAKLRENNVMDFDELVLLALEILRTSPEELQRYRAQCKAVLVDEFQDTDMAQYEIVRVLATGSNNLFVVGDVDQAIYGFRGADFKNMMTLFDADFPSSLTLQLQRNYRSHKNIVAFSSKLIARSMMDRNVGNLGSLELIPALEASGRLTMEELGNERYEADYIVRSILRRQRAGETNWRDFAVMYRTRMQSVPLEEVLAKEGIPYYVIGGMPFYQRKEVKDILAYLRLMVNPYDSMSLRRVLNVPKRGLGPATEDALNTWAQNMGMLLPEALLEYGSSLPGKDVLPIGPKNRLSVAAFCALLEGLRADCSSLYIGKIVQLVVDRTSYMEHAKKDESEDVVLQLVQVARSKSVLTAPGLPSITSFLETVALLSSTDSMDQEEGSAEAAEDKDAVRLMTIHAAKGLEFPYVYVAGVEKNIIPHANTKAGNQIDEERRVLYVAATRAEKELCLSWCTERFNPRSCRYEKAGVSEFLVPFLREGFKGVT